MALLRGSILAEMMRGDKPRPVNMQGAGAKVSFASTPHWSKKAFTVKNAPYTIDYPTRAQLETRIKFGRRARSMRGKRGMQVVTRSNSKARGMQLPAVAAGIANSSLGKSGYSKPKGMHASELRHTVHTMEELEALRSGAGVSVAGIRVGGKKRRKSRKSKRKAKTFRVKVKAKRKSRKGKRRAAKKSKRKSKSKRKKSRKVKFKRKKARKSKSRRKGPKLSPGVHIIQKGKMKGRRVRVLNNGRWRFLKSKGKKKGRKAGRKGRKAGRKSKSRKTKRKGSRRKAGRKSRRRSKRVYINTERGVFVKRRGRKSKRYTAGSPIGIGYGKAYRGIRKGSKRGKAGNVRPFYVTGGQISSGRSR